jgi:hypothetical protein
MLQSVFPMAHCFFAPCVQGEYVSEERPTPLLDTVNFPIHIKNLNKKVWSYMIAHIVLNFLDSVKS